jgi:hypothetical protein
LSSSVYLYRDPFTYAWMYIVYIRSLSAGNRNGQKYIFLLYSTVKTYK